MNRLISHRPGVTSVIAMMYLVLFASMAIGFYVSAGTAIEVSSNEQEQARSLGAAESGLEFIRFQLAQVSIPPNTTSTTMMNAVYTQLGTLLNGTPNMKGNTVQLDAGIVTVPGGSGKYISLDGDGNGFQAKISYVSDGRLRIQVMGRSNRSAAYPTHRGVQMEFTVSPQRSPILDYGLASNGNFSLGNGYVKGVPDAARGKVYTGSSTSSTPITMSGATISGDVMMANPAGHVSGAGSIAGIIDPTQWGSHVQSGVTPPEFPTIDPSPYINYLAGKETLISSNQSGVTLSNIRVKAGTNVQFSGCTLKGVILIEAPNKITFSSGSTNITGVIVVDKPNEPTSTNSITFSGGGAISGPENLDASYAPLTSMTGASILAPNFNTTFSGGSTSIGGSIVVKNAVFSGGSGGVVNGTVMIAGTGTLTLSGGSGFTIGNGSAGIPTGMRFSGPMIPEPTTYDEIKISGW